MNHIFQTTVLIMECIELNWLCKHIEKIRSSQPAIAVLNWVKHQSFPVSIVNIRIIKLRCISAPPSWSHINNIIALTILTIWNIQCLHLMYDEVAWVLVSLGTLAQPQIIPDPDYRADYPCLCYAYGYWN